MPSPIDSLVNQLVPLRSTGGTLSPATQSAVIEAVVLSNSPLLHTGDGKPQVKVTVGNQQQQFELTTQVPIPEGARVQLKIAANNLAVLIAIDHRGANRQPVATPTAAGLPPLAGTASAVATAGSTANTILTPNPLLASRGETAASLSQTAARQLIEQTVRQVLPQQQSLRTLTPLLDSVLSQSRDLPKALAVSLNHLRNQFPTAEQLQHPAPVKQVIRNSGIFFEGKLARQIQAGPTPTPTGDKPANHPNTPINQDIKGLIERILPQLQSATRAGTPATTPPLTAAPTGPEILAQLRDEFAAPLTPQAAAGLEQPQVTGGGKPLDQGLDILLRQLGRQLLATLAKTQVNQLESLATRHPATPDAPVPNNSWSLEIPIVHGNRTDNLELLIEEQLSNAQSDRERKKQWTVTLNFDLHQLGRMQVQLNIVEKTVSAAVWSQQRQTHEQVRKTIQELKTDLERVGVTVNKMECHWGEAPKNRSALYQQLVDVRT